MSKNNWKAKPVDLRKVYPSPVDELGACDTPCVKVIKPDYIPVTIYQEEETMNYNIATPLTESEQQRNYMTVRLVTAESNQVQKIREKYRIDAPAPKTKADLLARLTGGKFTIEDDYFDKNGDLKEYENIKYAFTWEDPTNPADTAGYKSAKALLKQAFMDAKDAIVVKPVEDGLAALKAFETQTF